MEYVTLNNGIKMPMAGIGIFLLTPDGRKHPSSMPGVWLSPDRHGKRLCQ